MLVEPSAKIFATRISPPMSYIVSGSRPTRRCFISYHHADQAVVDTFIRTFDHAWDVFSARGLGQGMAQDIIDSTDTDYVMSRIRSDYLKGSSVTIVMLGRCTWARRYVDWEIQSSLRQGATIVPNGLLGIKLPSFAGVFPERFGKNLIPPDSDQADCYARWMAYPTSVTALQDEIEAAYQRRTTHTRWIVNPRDRFTYNRTC